MNRFKIKIIALVGLIDILVAGLLTITFDLNGITGIIAILCFTLINIIISFIFKAYYKKLLFYININILLFPLLFYIILIMWVSHQIKKEFEVKRFSKGITKYQIDINIKDSTYTIYKVLGNDYNYLKGLIDGRTALACDTLYLLDTVNNRRIFIHGDTLIGYPDLKDSITVDDN